MKNQMAGLGSRLESLENADAASSIAGSIAEVAEESVNPLSHA